MHILVYSDGPVCPTGFGVVNRNIFEPLFQRDVCQRETTNFYSINYVGEWHPDQKNYRLWPANIGLRADPDPYGRDRFCQMALAGVWPIDVLFILQDHFTVAPFVPALVQKLREQVAAGLRPPFVTIFYIPVDNHFLKPPWVDWVPEHVDFAVAYMHWSARVITDLVPRLDGKLRVIYHGTNPETYYPIPEAEREQFRQQVMGLKPGQPLMLFVNRNQPRKDPARALQILNLARARLPELVGYFHLNPQDSAGFSMGEVAGQLRLPQGVVRFPANFSEGIGVPVDVLNRIYNAADVFVTTARGEGYGLSVTEAMCAGRLCIAPKHTSFAELLADDRGLLVPPLKGGDAVLPMDNDQFRPCADVDAMAQKVVWALEHREHAAGIARRGMEWAQALAWSGPIADQWEQVFREAYAEVAKRRAPQPAATGTFRFTADALPAGLTAAA